ncbi:MAG: putative secreted protein with C-terminal beta-propeller domain [Halieaceae bacterium]
MRIDVRLHLTNKRGIILKTAIGSVVTVIALAVSGCGGGGGSSDPVVIDVTLPAPPPPGLLMPVETADQFTENFRVALQGSDYLSSAENVVFAVEDSSVSAGTGGMDSLASKSGDFSETTLQEEGVDEADLVKYDGSHMFIVDTPQQNYYYLDAGISAIQAPPESPPASIRIMATDPVSAGVEEVGRIELNGDKSLSINGIYLANFSGSKQLVAVSQNNPFVYWGKFAADYYWQNGATTIESFDVTDVTAVTPSWSLRLDGSLLASRRIGNILYLVTRYSPVVEGVLSYPQSDEQVTKNKELIAAVSVEELLPDVVINDGVPQELLDPRDCYIPNQDYELLPVPPSSGTLVTITAIDLESPDSINSTCLNAYTSGFYASADALYLTASGNNMTTLIHKFALQGAGAEYRGSGSVPGYIGTRNPSFLMGEHNGDLRVVSSTWENRFFPLPLMELDDDAVASDAVVEEKEDFGRHRLSVLRESDTETALETLATLPNTLQPAHIGKPGEDIYAVRYLGDRGYIVTFQVIDPLYVLDLSTPEEPVIAGELEIPGYSTLLQPLGETLLLGVGQFVHDELPNSLQGVKIEVFNVADIDAPVSMGSIEIGRRGSYSPALDDHHALTLLETSEGFRAAIPVQRNDELNQWGGDPEDPWYYYGWSDTGLYMFDIDGGSGKLSSAGSLIVEENTPEQDYQQSDLSRSRSVLHDDAVYFLHGNKVWPAFWGDGESLGDER